MPAALHKFVCVIYLFLDLLKINNQVFFIAPTTQSGEKVHRKVQGVPQSDAAGNPWNLVSYAVVKAESSNDKDLHSCFFITDLKALFQGS